MSWLLAGASWVISGGVGADGGEVLLDPALHSGDPVILQPNDLFARIGVAVAGERFLELLLAVKLVAQLNCEGVELDEVVGEGNLLVDRLERAQRFGAVAFLGVELGQHRRAAHRVGGANFLAGQFFQRANRVVGFACRFKSFRFEKQGLFAHLRIVLQRRHLGRGRLEVFAEKIRLGDGESGSARVRALREFRPVNLESGDRLRDNRRR